MFSNNIGAKSGKLNKENVNPVSLGLEHTRYVFIQKHTRVPMAKAWSKGKHKHIMGSEDSIVSSTLVRSLHSSVWQSTIVRQALLQTERKPGNLRSSVKLFSQPELRPGYLRSSSNQGIKQAWQSNLFLQPGPDTLCRSSS